MLNTFLFTLPPPPPSESSEEGDAAEDAVAAASNGGMNDLSARSRRKFSFIRQIFAAKKTKNSQWNAGKICLGHFHISHFEKDEIVMINLWIFMEKLSNRLKKIMS